MADCETFRDQLLEADSLALSGALDTALARHLAGCPSCRRDAELILAGEHALATALGSMQPSTPLPPVVELAGWRSRRRWWLMASAAAVIALVWTGSTVRDAGQLDAPARVVEAPSGPEVAARRNTVFLKTDNPDITIVWFY